MLTGYKMSDANRLDLAVYSNYSKSVPYYTSYPVLSQWQEFYQARDYRAALSDFCKTSGDEPVSIYVHFPYCAKMCWYCICNFAVTHNRETIQRFLRHLHKEIDMLGDVFDAHDFKPNITDIHLGGGTPSYMENEEVGALLEKLERLQRPGCEKELTIEIDIRTATRENVEYYAELGIQRLSFGIQDFNADVQKAINREQTPERFHEVFPTELRGHFNSFNFDLLYGLPKQTIESFRETMDIVTDLRPSRVTLLKYAHTPELRKHMRLIDTADLPDELTNKVIFDNAIQQFKNAGYNHIGIDHFALDTDRLSEADKNKHVGRSFLGFNPSQFQHLLGLGPSSTACFGNYYFQNISPIAQYCDLIAQGDFAIERGYTLNIDDVIRREVIFAILCDRRVDLKEIASKYGIDAYEYFADELDSLVPLIRDGVMQLEGGVITVTELGRLYIQHICVRFDGHINAEHYQLAGPTIITASA